MGPPARRRVLVHARAQHCETDGPLRGRRCVLRVEVMKSARAYTACARSAPRPEVLRGYGFAGGGGTESPGRGGGGGGTAAGRWGGALLAAATAGTTAAEAEAVSDKAAVAATGPPSHPQEVDPVAAVVRDRSRSRSRSRTETEGETGTGAHREKKYWTDIACFLGESRSIDRIRVQKAVTTYKLLR